MIVFTGRVKSTREHNCTLTLIYELRQKARLKTKSDSGEEVGLMLSRGEILRGGDYVQSEEGVIAKIIAAPEEVSVVTSDNRILLTKAAYHLGNRHMALQIEETFLVYQRDHVLDEMIRNLGLSVAHEIQPFEPESGAYNSHSHSH